MDGKQAMIGGVQAERCQSNLFRWAVHRPIRTLLVIGFAGLAQADEHWQVNYEQSRIEFAAVQEGSVLEGFFGEFNAKILFDAANLDTSLFDVEIATASVNTASTDRDDILRSADFFNVAVWPSAHFKTNSINRVGKGRYQARATLAIRDIEHEVVFPFELEIKRSKQSQLLDGRGEITINRFDYDMAHGDWADPALVGPEIHVSVTLKASKPVQP